MTDLRREAPPLPFGLLAACFFGSGLTGLCYELLWTRRLYLTFGSTTTSVTTVLAAFMAGLGLGSYLLGRRADRSRTSDARLYGYLELGVGLYALIPLPLLSLVEKLYAALQSHLALGQAGASLLKFVLAFPVLALPAGLMGGTLPVLVRALVRSRQRLPSQVSLLYGINTIGAAFGTAVTGFVLIEVLGLWLAMVLAAAINLSIAVLVLGRLGRAPAGEERDFVGRASTGGSGPPGGAQFAPASAGAAPEVRLRQHLRTGPVLFCAVAVTATGLLSMLYEIIWTRMLTLLVGSSTYAFTIVLTVFLLGIALGALVYARSARDTPSTAFGLALLLLGLGLWVTTSLAAIPHLPALFIRLAQVPGTIDFIHLTVIEILLAVFVLLVPTLILGAALPMSMGIISRTLGQVGRDIGGIYLANTAGAIAGSILTGFVLIPLLGTQRTLLIGVLVNLALVAVGVAAFAGGSARRVAATTVTLLVAIAAVAQPPWPPLVFDSGLGFRLDGTLATNALDMEKKLRREPNRLVSLEEGLNSTISVRHFPTGLTLMVNGKPDASTSGDMVTQVVLAAVAMLAHPQPKDVGIVGWGSGVTAYVTTFFPEMERVDVVEIERAVLRASPLFAPVNGGIHDDPRLRVIFDDARSQFLTSRSRYDVVISEPSNPWMMGVSGLFSRDYYELAKRRLKPGGVFGQWLQLYRIDSRSVALILRTMMESFNDVQLWFSDPFDVILLASQQPIRIAPARVARAYQADRRLRLHMGVWGPGVQPEHFFGCFLVDRTALSRMLSRFRAEVMTDNKPVLEYRATRNIYGVTHQHIEELWKVKIALGQVLPPGSEPPTASRTSAEGLALAGAANVARRMPRLEAMITEWSMKRAGDAPQVRLARAKSLDRANQGERVIALLRTLPQDPGWRAEAALLEARVMVHNRRYQEALTKLSEMGRFRPTARLWYQIEAALGLGRVDLAWPWAEELIGALSNTWDQDVRLIQRDALYQRIGQLIRQTQQWERGVRLLTRRTEHYDGELQRLIALAEAYDRSGSPRLAAKTMDQVQQFGLIDKERLELCEKIYRNAREEAKADACRATRLRYVPEASDAPLWQ